jgi:hypothetical protein
MFCMKHKLYIALSAAAILFLLGEAGRGQKSDPVGQAWEYKMILRQRDIDDKRDLDIFTLNPDRNFAKDWSRWAEDNRELPAPVDIVAKLAQLGSQGWELVTINTRSDNGNSVPTAQSIGNNQYYSYNGVTTSDVWVFKRAKSRQ